MKLNASAPEPLVFLLLELQKQMRLLIKGLQQKDPELITKSLAREAYITNYFNQLGDQIDILADAFIWAQLAFHGQQASQSLNAIGKLVQVKNIKLDATKALYKQLKLADDLVQSITEQLKPTGQDNGGHERAKTRTQQLNILSLKTPENLTEHKLSILLAQLTLQLSQLSEQVASLATEYQAPTDQLRAVHASLSQADEIKNPPELAELQLEPLAHTKSGCVINKVAAQDEPELPIGVVKHGQRAKIKQEKNQFARWKDYAPDLVPELYGYHREGEQASLFVEFLDGMRLDLWLTQAKPKGYLASLALVCQRLEQVWLAKSQSNKTPQLFMQQLSARLDDVWHVHPHFKQELNQLGKMKGLKLRQLIKQAAKLETQLQPSNYYFGHGDLNLDNILLNPEDQQIYLVDLHRSGYHDYLQDIAVLMVSHFRLKLYDDAQRRLIADSMTQLYQFAQAFGTSQQDQFLHPRLALGLARSFITSTRFVLDDTHARALFDRGRLLLTLLLDYAKQHDPADFRIDTEIFYGPY